MSFPNIPREIPSINIDKEQAISLLLSSIAFEELGLSHIINAEAEKIQYVLGTLEGEKPTFNPTFKDLLMINESVKETMEKVNKNQLLLLFKLKDVAKIPQYQVKVNTATATANFGNEIVSASDKAYYHTTEGRCT